MIPELHDANFDKIILDQPLLAMVDFWQPWVAPCREIARTMEQLYEQYKGTVVIAKMNVDANQSIPQKYNIQEVPAILFFKAGVVVDTIIGPESKQYFEQKIKELLEQE